MLDRFTGLEVFSKIATLGSLSAAGRALGMSQTMATKHMTALEERLGTKLLHRTTRRTTLTEAGEVYLSKAEQILEELRTADAIAASATIEVKGRLRLNVPVSFGIKEIAPILPALTEKHKELEIELGLNDRQVNLIEEGWDMAIRIGQLQNSTLIARRLAACNMIMAAAPSYLKMYGTPKNIKELNGHNCLGYTLSSMAGVKQWAFGKKGTIKIPVKGRLTANNGDALVAAAIAGEGLIYQPEFLVADEIRAGKLIQLELDQPLFELDGIYAIYPEDRTPPAKIRAAIDFFLAQWGSNPPWQMEIKKSAQKRL